MDRGMNRIASALLRKRSIGIIIRENSSLANLFLVQRKKGREKKELCEEVREIYLIS